MVRVTFSTVGANSPFRPFVEQQFKKIIAPLYGEQQNSLQKIFNGNDRTCELIFLETDLQQKSPLGLLVYKNDLSNEYAKYGIDRGLEIKTLFLIDSEKNSGKGLGTALISRVLSKCAEKKAENVFLTASSKALLSPVDFFKRLHFTEKHQWRGKFQNNATEYLLSRRVHLHQITLQEKYLRKMIDGSKTREGRTNTGMFTRINVGELIRFFNPTTKSQIYTEVISVDKVSNFREMLNDGKLKDYLPDVYSIDKAVEIYHSIPSYLEKANQHGVVGFELKKIEIDGETDKMKSKESKVLTDERGVPQVIASSSTKKRRKPQHLYFDEEGKAFEKKQRVERHMEIPPKK